MKTKLTHRNHKEAAVKRVFFDSLFIYYSIAGFYQGRIFHEMLMRADSFLCWDWDDPDPDLSEKFHLGMYCHFVFDGWLSFVLREIRAKNAFRLPLPAAGRLLHDLSFCRGVSPAVRCFDSDGTLFYIE